ncbi:hypothetical protein HZA41_01080 [Candidatus Peregrinibacteria bacterium]|nr:hypothetical protein [Candidatus Peregrinibacteria bacterium]
MNQPVENITPYQPTAVSLMLRILSGFLGGIGGTIMMATIFLVSSSTLKPIFQPDGTEKTVGGLFIFIFMGMIFLGIMAANMMVTILSAISERGKYSRLNSALYQIFIVNVIIFILLAPMYVMVSGAGLMVAGYIAGFHAIISAIASVMILELIGNPSHALIGVYSVVLGLLGLAGFIVLTFFALAMTSNPAGVILFVGLPLLWTLLSTAGAFSDLLYKFIYSLYGVDFLRTDVSYGRDVVGGEEDELTQEEIEAQVAQEKKDVKGRDFLEGKK